METPRYAIADADAAALLASLLGEPVVVRHLCPACGSDRHGRPWIQLRDGSRPDVSIAHRGGLTVVGVAASGRVGVDLEAIDAVVPAGIAHPRDWLTGVELWVRKEAFVKATGEGLRRDLASIAPDEPGATWLQIDAGPHHRAALCWLP